MNRALGAVLAAAVFHAAGVSAQATASQDSQRIRVRTHVEVQLRHVAHLEERAPGVDGHAAGFQLRRARLDLTVSKPGFPLEARFRPAYGTSGSLGLEYAYATWRPGPQWQVRAGQFKPQFVREENVSAFGQLAIERSWAADYFTIDYTQAIEVVYSGSRVRLDGSLHDGSYARDVDFQNDRTAASLAGRAELRVLGDWAGLADFEPGSGGGPDMLLGIAADREVGEGGSGAPDVLKLTGDLSLAWHAASAFLGLYAQRFDPAAGDTGALASRLDAARQHGVVMQAGIRLAPAALDLFGRWERTDFDGIYYRNAGTGVQSGSGPVAGGWLRIATAGANVHVREGLRLSIDLQRTTGAVPVANTGGGLLGMTRDQTVVRTQLQLTY